MSSVVRARQILTITTALFAIVLPACLRPPRDQFGAMSDGRRGRIRDLKIEIDRSTDLSMPDQREARRENINKLIDNLKQEGTVYPHLADALDKLGKLAYEGLRVAGTQLGLDVRCTGFKLPVVMETLGFIRSLDS